MLKIDHKTNELDLIQTYLSQNISVFPVVYFLFLEKMLAEERNSNLCLLPYVKLELYHLRFQKRKCEKQNKRKLLSKHQAA